MWLVLAAVLTFPAGYVNDSLCGECHRELAASYAHVGMSQSFSRPRASKVIEDFDAAPYFHAKSNQYFEMRKRGDDVVFRRYQLVDGKQVNVFEQIVDWILGSGHHSRTYLYATPNGELYQLPTAWYTQPRAWRMSPGYDRADHDGVTRRVRHECMFCHNAYAGVATLSESYWRPQMFPAELPQGIGCQRCHGPGARHSAIALTGNVEKTKSSIVNPAKLDVRRRMDVCYECHMQPAVALFGVRKFGRDINSFRPGQLLADYAPPINIAEKDRFEINHHPYRLEQSRCFRESAGKLTCLTCHDPHRRLAREQYRAACLSCHEKAHRANEDCIPCHMPQRRTQDVVHVVMTDHLIQRKPEANLLAPLEERESQVSGVHFLYGGDDPLLLLLPLVRAHGGASADEVNRLAQLLAEPKANSTSASSSPATAAHATRSRTTSAHSRCVRTSWRRGCGLRKRSGSWGTRTRLRARSGRARSKIDKTNRTDKTHRTSYRSYLSYLSYLSYQSYFTIATGRNPPGFGYSRRSASWPSGVAMIGTTLPAIVAVFPVGCALSIFIGRRMRIFFGSSTFAPPRSSTMSGMKTSAFPGTPVIVSCAFSAPGALKPIVAFSGGTSRITNAPFGAMPPDEYCELSTHSDTD